jgi:hypothetical protein
MASTKQPASEKSRGPLMAAGAAAVGLAGGLALGSRRRKSTAVRALEVLRDGAKHLNSATAQMSGTTEDVREIREQLDRVNRKSPLEVALDGLTHRRGAHKRES